MKNWPAPPLRLRKQPPPPTPKVKHLTEEEVQARVRAETQRLWDLCRSQRFELHNADLISNEEYANLAFDHGAVSRLETYDEMNVRLKKVNKVAELVKRTLEKFISETSDARVVTEAEQVLTQIKEIYNAKPSQAPFQKEDAAPERSAS